MAVHTTQAEIVIRLTDEDRILLRQLIDRLANPVQPVLPNPYPNPYQFPTWTNLNPDPNSNKVDC